MIGLEFAPAMEWSSGSLDGSKKSCKATTSNLAKIWRPRCIDMSGATTNNSRNQP